MPDFAINKRKYHVLSRLPIWTFFGLNWLNLIIHEFLTVDFYNHASFYVAELFQVSTLTSIVFLIMCWGLNFCRYNWVASIFLLISNILNLLFIGSGEEGFNIYNLTITIYSMACFSTIGLILFYTKK